MHGSSSGVSSLSKGPGDSRIKSNRHRLLKSNRHRLLKSNRHRLLKSNRHRLLKSVAARRRSGPLIPGVNGGNFIYFSSDEPGVGEKMFVFVNSSFSWR